MANVYDGIRATALVVVFCTLVWRDKKVWMKADAIFSGFYALRLILCPSCVIEFETDDVTPDALHCCAARSIAVFMGCNVAFWYLCRDSRDESVTGSIMLSKFMTSLVVLLTMVYGHLQYSDKFNEKHMLFNGLSVFLLCVSALTQLVRSRFVLGRREQKGGVSVILRIIFLIQLFAGLKNMAFPRMSLSVIQDVRVDEIHLHFVRLTGAMIVGLSFMTWYVPAYRNNEDKKSFLAVSVLGQMALAAVLTLTFLTGGIKSVEYVKLLLGFLPVVLPLLGLILIRQGNKSTDPVNTGGYYTRSKTN